MGVLDDKDRWGPAGRRGRIDQHGQPPSTRIGIDLRQFDIGIGDAQQVLEQQHVLRHHFGSLRPDPRPGGGRIKVLDANGCAQQFCYGMEWDLAGVRLAEGSEHVNTLGAGYRRNFTH